MIGVLVMPQILLDLAMPMNGAALVPDASGSLQFRTHPSCGGHSGYIPIRRKIDEQGAIEFEIDIDVEFGSIGIAAVDDQLTIVSERFSSVGGGSQKLLLRVPDLTCVAGLLLRNAGDRGKSAEGRLIEIVARPTSEKIFAIPRPTFSDILSIPLRRLESPVGGTEESPHSGGRRRTDLEEISVANTVVVVIDPWADHPCQGWARRMNDNMSRFLFPALTALRSAGIPIIYAPHDRPIHPVIAPRIGELILESISDPKLIAQAFNEGGISRIIYMGYASNYCLLSRPIGAINMWREGFGVIVVRDASLAIETSETFQGHWSHHVMMDFVEASLGATVSVAEIDDACKALCDARERVSM